MILFGLFEVGSHWAVDAEVTGMAERARAQWLLSILDTKVPLSRMFGWSSMLPHSGPGLVMGLAAALGLVAPAALRWRTLPWALGAVLFMVLAMGPTMIALPDGGVTAFPHDPLAAVVPFLRRFHYANRFMLMGGVCLAVMAAVGVAGLVRFLERCCGWRMAGIFPAILLLLLALQQVSLLFPVTVGPMSLEVTRFYEGLERREGQGILVLHDGEEGSSTLVAQMEHEIPYCCLSMPDGMRPDGMEEAQKRSPLFTFLSQNLHPNLSPMCPSGTMRRQRLERLGLYDGAVAEVDSWRGRFEDRVAEGSEEFQALLDDDPALLGQMGYSHVVVVVGRTGMRGPDVIRYWAALHAILRHHFGEPVVSGEETGATYAAYEIPRDGAE